MGKAEIAIDQLRVKRTGNAHQTHTRRTPHAQYVCAKCVFGLCLYCICLEAGATTSLK
jgi:hypothetical protein